jgi:hypothetical protein
MGPVHTDARAKSEVGPRRQAFMRFRSADGRLIDRRHRRPAPDPTAIHRDCRRAFGTAECVRAFSLEKGDGRGATPRAGKGARAFARRRPGCPRPPAPSASCRPDAPLPGRRPSPCYPRSRRRAEVQRNTAPRTRRSPDVGLGRLIGSRPTSHTIWATPMTAKPQPPSTRQTARRSGRSRYRQKGRLPKAPLH